MSIEKSRPKLRGQGTLSTQLHNERLLADLKPGDIVKFSRGLYDHFAIYIGDEMVIHVCELEDFASSELVRTSLVASVASAPQTKVRIAEESFWKAAKDSKGYIANNERYESFEVDEILRRAKQCLGRMDYHFLLKNCEHWVNKIKYDREESKQASDFKIGVGVTGAILGVGAIGLAAFAIIRKLNKKESKSQSQSLEFA